MTTGRILAEFADYDGMLAAVRARVDELAINGERFDDYAGLPKGYLSKLTGVKPVRRIAMTSMGVLFSALGVYCVLIENDEATNQLKSKIKPRNNSYKRTSYTVNSLTNRKWAQIQKLGRQARWKKLSKKQRFEIMRAVSMKRWRGA